MNVGGDLWRHPAGKDRLEMPPGKGVFALEEKCSGELQTHANETGIGNQHLPESGDGLVKRGVAAVFVFRAGRSLDRRHALVEHGVQILRGGGKREQKDENGKGATRGASDQTG